MTLAEEIQAYMQAQDWESKITRGNAPPKPDACVTIYITTGLAPDNYAGAVNPSVQFVCRGSTHVEAETLAWRVFHLFNDKQMYHLINLYVLNSYAITSPLHIGRDEENRTLFSVNIRFKLEAPRA